VGIQPGLDLIHERGFERGEVGAVVGVEERREQAFVGEEEPARDDGAEDLDAGGPREQPRAARQVPVVEPLLEHGGVPFGFVRAFALRLVVYERVPQRDGHGFAGRVGGERAGEGTPFAVCVDVGLEDGQEAGVERHVVREFEFFGFGPADDRLGRCRDGADAFSQQG